MIELLLPNMRAWRYARLGACVRCGADEAPGFRTYSRRNPTPGESLDEPMCCACARAYDEAANEANETRSR